MSSVSQQPVLVYPNTGVTGQQQQSSSSHHSNGSFGTVFIVLAVIVVVSAVACFLGRLCNKRMHPPKAGKQNQAALKPRESRPAREREMRDPEFRFEGRPKEKDIEFGFDGRIPNGKAANNGGGGEMKGSYKASANGDGYGESKHAHAHGDFRGSA